MITAKKQKVDDYVSDYYTTIRCLWRKTYEHSIRHVEWIKLWPMLNRLPVLPPSNRLGNRGRQSTYTRKKSANESSSSSSKTKLSRDKRTMTCSNCREEGHTKVGCSKPTVEPEPKRSRGCPRKNLVRNCCSHYVFTYKQCSYHMCSVLCRKEDHKVVDARL